MFKEPQSFQENFFTINQTRPRRLTIWLGAALLHPRTLGFSFGTCSAEEGGPEAPRPDGEEDEVEAAGPGDEVEAAECEAEPGLEEAAAVLEAEPSSARRC